ncbi:hypothetical protein EX895_004666 [Sporisorium graminicola]|uniref:Heparan-alpha-glucosaminide N-acetyltransferase catalytic domain-containing protein n=1 Tax=Sporisorium graminicola TaxID=280036 RepID=A0A4U7KRF8_9BASI|nr:hypothetical protein EX895_004666 [Sporisorium graminicola]TKY86517.1 hypothetical protein EX895_004666 [Sporisorium graminicola]
MMASTQHSATAQDPEAGAPVQDTNFALPTSAPPTTSNYGSTPTTASALTASKPTSTSSRAVAPDLLRGLILLLMSLDHAALFLGAWLHGTPKQSESAGTPFTRWNFNTAYISRTATHLCAPGFFLLMGMGCVYFHRSRAKIGWSRSRMVWHFTVRAIALTVVSEVMGATMMRRYNILVFNIVLIGLAVDYLLTGLLCLVMDATEGAVTRWLDAGLGEAVKQRVDGETRPLLSSDNGTLTAATLTAPSTRSQTLSFWLHNAVLALLTYITIFWNVWLSPNGGHCPPTSLSPSRSPSSTAPIELLALLPATNTAASAVQQSASPPGSHLGAWFDFWFYPVENEWVVSGFPPLAWISFCLFGMLYARIMLHKRWTARAVVAWNVGVAATLALLFVATRVLHFGNLSEGCLQMDEQHARPDANQYLVSVKSFFYITKYPPSPSFMFFTMAVNFAMLAVFSAIPPALATAIPGLMNYGGSALFFYVAHMYLYRLLSIPVRYFFEHELEDKPPNEWERTTGVGSTAPFWITWVVGLLLLSPMCRAYGRFKAAQSTDSLWRFF